jgi:hypothetical protein
MRLIRRSALLVLAALAAPPALAAVPAAEVLLLTGAGTVSNPGDGEIRSLAKGDKVYSGEVVSSGANSYVNLKFSDGSFVLLRPNTRFVIEDFVDASQPVAGAPVPPKPAETKPVESAQPSAPKPPEAKPVEPPAPIAAAISRPTASRAFFRLLKGGFRAVSGLIGHVERNEYRVTTAVATIGIRGTDYVAVICDAACARDPVVREDLPAGAGAEGGLVTGVITGGIGIASGADAASCLDPNSGEIRAGSQCTATSELGTGNYLVVTPQGQHVPLDKVPRFLQVDPIPNPTTICL